MIVEMRTYSFHPGMASLALERIAQGVSERTRLSPLGGLWLSDIGRQHQIVHLWPYDSFAHREAVRSRFPELEHWPARTAEFTAESETKVMRPASFSPPLQAGLSGPVYEICTDTYRADALETILALWSASISARIALAPLIGAWHTILGPMNQWIHIWAYKTLGQRTDVHEACARKGIWPPKTDAALFVKQESAIFHPAPFSPLQ